MKAGGNEGDVPPTRVSTIGNSRMMSHLSRRPIFATATEIREMIGRLALRQFDGVAVATRPARETTHGECVHPMISPFPNDAP